MGCGHSQDELKERIKNLQHKISEVEGRWGCLMISLKEKRSALEELRRSNKLKHQKRISLVAQLQSRLEKIRNQLEQQRRSQEGLVYLDQIDLSVISIRENHYDKESRAVISCGKSWL